MNYLNTHPYAKIGVFSLLLLPFIFLLNSFSPDLSKVPIGFSSSIVAFEFVSNPKELNEVLSPLSEEDIFDLDKLNYVDFGFMLVYTGLLLLFIRKSFNLFGHPLMKYLLIFSPIILLGDILENVQLLKLTKLYLGDAAEGDLISPIKLLEIFTWIKWGALAVCFACISYFLYNKGTLAKAMSLLFFIPLILLFLYLSLDNRIYLDQFASSIFLMFFLLIIFSFIYKFDRDLILPVNEQVF